MDPEPDPTALKLNQFNFKIFIRVFTLFYYGPALGPHYNALGPHCIETDHNQKLLVHFYVLFQFLLTFGLYFHLLLRTFSLTKEK